MEDNEYKKIELPKNDRMQIILVTRKDGKRKKYKNPKQAYKIFRDILEFDYCVGLGNFKYYCVGLGNFKYMTPKCKI